MSFSTLHSDPLHEILLRLGPSDLINQCESDYRFNRLCQDPVFLRSYLGQYGMSSDQVPGRTIREKLQFLSGFDWQIVPGATLQEKGRFITNIIQRANTDDLNTFVREHYGGPQAQRRFAGQDYMINRNFRNILGKAVQTGNPQFVQMVLNRLIERVGLQHIPQYVNSFRDPFVDATSMAFRADPRMRPQTWFQIGDLLRQYYDPLTDPVAFSGVYADAIRKGNLPRVKALSLIFRPDEEGFWMAVENARPEVAAFFWDYLQHGGIDPVANNPDAVDEAYGEAIHTDDVDIARTVAQYAPPNEQILAEAEQANAPRVTAFIRTLLHQ